MEKYYAQLIMKGTPNTKGERNLLNYPVWRGTTFHIYNETVDISYLNPKKLRLSSTKHYIEVIFFIEL